MELEAALLAAEALPNVVDYVENYAVQLTLVGAGYGLGLVLATQADTIQRQDIVVCQLASPPPLVKTFLIYRGGESSGLVACFLERARSIS
jgi:DNA-binding transcriptional LysR family regulator